MESETELNEKIMAITMQIQNEFPELSKYLNEMPVTIPTEENPEINTKVLNNYYESLLRMLTTYKLEMTEKVTIKNSKND